MSLLVENASHIAPLVSAHPAYLRKLTSTLLEYWDEGKHELKAALITACGSVLATIASNGGGEAYTQLLVKKMYLALTSAAKKSISNQTAVKAMKQSILEVLNKNEDVAYQSGFLFLRQIAIHIRKVMQKPSAEIFAS